MNQKGNFLPIIGIVLLLLVVGGGAYYLGLQNRLSAIEAVDYQVLETDPLDYVEPTPLEIDTNTVINKCEGNDGNFSVKASNQPGWCEGTFKPYGVGSDYSLIFPDNWIGSMTGAGGVNVVFLEKESDKDSFGNIQKLLIQFERTQLPLEQADKATSGYEMSGPDPLVDPSEEIISKKIENIGDKRVLNLVTRHEGKIIQRYFLLHKENEWSSLYLFTTSGDNKAFLEDLKPAISSMKFLE